MKSFNIFKKALYLYYSSYVTLNCKKEKVRWYDVYDPEEENQEVLVKIGYEKLGYLILDCNCKHQGSKSTHNPICSHKIAVILQEAHEHKKNER